MNANTSRGATPRRRRLIAAAATAGLTFAGMGLASMAQAGTAPPFDIEGNVPDSGAVLFQDGYGKAQELGPVNSNLTKLGVIHSAMPPMLDTTNPNAQVDLRNIWLDSARDADGDAWVYIAWERDSNKGTGVLMYEFMQDQEPVACDYDTMDDAELIAGCNPWANRQPGDFILVWDQQGGTVTIIIRTWYDPDMDGMWEKGDPLALDAGVLVPSDYGQAALSADGYFGEGAINLTQTVFAGVEACTTIGNVIPGTVTGNSDTADFKDTVLADVSDHLTISNCGSVKVIKDTDPEGGTGNFDWALTRDGGADLRYVADYPPPASLTSVTGTLTGDGDYDTAINLIAGTDYTLDETSLPTGYDKTFIVCITGLGTADTADDVSYTVFSADPDVTPVDFPVIEGETTVCTITNTARGTIVIEKIINDGLTSPATTFAFTSDLPTDPAGGAFSLAPSATGTGGKASRTFSNLAPDSYAVAETVPEHWNLLSSTCVSDFGPGEAGTISAIDLDPGETITCTFTNEVQKGSLLIVKTAKHAADDDEADPPLNEIPHAGVTFTVTGGSTPAEGTTAVTGSDGTVCVTGLQVSGFAGNYTVAETVPAGYAVVGSDTQSGLAVTNVADCGEGVVTATFQNMPLTDITVSVDSQIVGGTASTMSCVLDGATEELLDNTSTSTDAADWGDGSGTAEDLLPGTYVCTIVVDP